MDAESQVLSSYLARIGRVKLLTSEEELRLSQAARAGDDSAAKALAEANLRLVVHLATRYAKHGVALRELIAAGNVGLMRAVQTFEARPDSRFAAYACWWIRRHMLRTLMEEGRSARLPLNRLSQLGALRRERAAHRERTGREPTAAELAEVLSLPASKVISLLAVASRPASLDAPVGAEGESHTTLGDFLADENAEDPASECARRAGSEDVRRLLDGLSPREAGVLRQRFGLGGGEPRTCEEIGRGLGLTRERVRQIQDKALRRLRAAHEELSRKRTREERVADGVSAGRMRVWLDFARKIADKGPGAPRSGVGLGAPRLA